MHAGTMNCNHGANVFAYSLLSSSPLQAPGYKRCYAVCDNYADVCQTVQSNLLTNHASKSVLYLCNEHKMFSQACVDKLLGIDRVVEIELLMASRITGCDVSGCINLGMGEIRCCTVRFSGLGTTAKYYLCPADIPRLRPEICPSSQSHHNYNLRQRIE